MCNTGNADNAIRQINNAREYLREQYDTVSISPHQLLWPENDIIGIAAGNAAKCDTVYLCKGWQMCKCSLSVFEIARIYNKTIIFE